MIAYLLTAALLTPHSYACRGGSDELRSVWAVWIAVAGRRCVIAPP
jgi:hypothetical protein